MSTSYPCPQCGATASLPDGCPACGAGPDTEAAEVIRLDGEIADLRRQLEEARARVTGLHRRIQDAQSRRTHLAASVVSRRTPGPGPTPGPAPTSGPGRDPHAPAPLAPVPVPLPVAEPRLSVLTVQNVLFTLGGLLLVVAAAVFTAVAWAQVGVTGRALLLAGATAAILAVPPFAARRGLTAAAETLATVGLLMILLDGFAAWAVDFLFVRALGPSAYAATVLTFTTVIALAYSWPTRLRGPRIFALLVAQPVFPLLANAADAGLTGWALAFSVTAVVDLVALRVRPERFAHDGAGVLAYVCAALAAAAAGTISLADLALATTPLAAAQAGGTLLLPPLTLLAWALTARRPTAQAIGAGLLVVTAGVAGTRWAWTLPIDFEGSGWHGSRIALLALLLAATAALLRRLPAAPLQDTATVPAAVPVQGPATVPAAPLQDTATVPAAVRKGAWVGALVVASAPAIAVVVAALSAAVHSAAAAARLWGTPMDVTVTGAEPDMLVATVVTAVAYALLLPRRTHPDLGLTALAALGFLIPAALGLPWWTAAMIGVAVAASALLLAARSRTLPGAAYRIAVCLAAMTHAVVTGCGHAAVAAGVCGAIALLGLGTAAALRNAPRGADVGAGSLTVGLIAVPPAVWLALFAADVPVTTRVRVSLGVAVLLVAVAHVGARRLPAYAPYALGVALLAAGTTPVWAAPAADPLALYAAAGLLLVVVLLPIPAVRDGGGAIAVLLPAFALFALTAADMAVVVLEPWTALDGIWSGVAPRQSPVAWSSVVALTIAALAASAAGWLLTHSTTVALTTDNQPVTDSTTTPPATSQPPNSTSTLLATSQPVADSTARPIGTGEVPAGSTGDSAGSTASTSPGPEPASAGGHDSPSAVPPAVTDQPGDTTSRGPATPVSQPADASPAGAWAAAGRPAGESSGTGAGRASSPELVGVWAAAPLLAIIVPMVFAAAGAAWPAVPITALVAGLAGLLAVAFAPARHMASGPLTVVFGALTAAGTAGAAAGHGATITAFLLLVAASGVAGVAGLRESDRVAAWAVGTISVVVLAYTVADATDLGVGAPPLFVLAAAALVVVLEAVLASRRPAEAWAPFAVGHTAAVLALAITESLGWAALVCKLWALVLTVRALRPGENHRLRYGVASGSVALAGWWFLLSSRDVETTEIYTLPAAALAVVASWFARRARPGLPSWTAYGAALAAAFLPTLAVIANSAAGEPHYLRRLLLGVGALLVLLAGARARLQAPVVTGGGTLLLVALHELVQFWDLVPRWMPLAVGGLLLVGIATTMEQRRRDLARLRAAVARMT